ncbi:unnamed protein product [Allacma fusca]|uniref:Uncharacterized protein n=1 Tax=Allacma fusca TaxID=39272 RepID=A0A8J2JRW2_9HEXA|nr:unnamed protein product [Allacma fusca]
MYLPSHGVDEPLRQQPERDSSVSLWTNEIDQTDALQDMRLPTTREGKSFSTWLKGLVNLIDEQNSNVGIPLKDAFKECHTALYQATNITDKLSTLLQDMNIIDEAAAKIMVNCHLHSFENCFDYVVGRRQY